MTRAVLFGSYELIERVGEGGMAEVWRARSRGAAGFEKTVVIKRVLPSLMARPDFAAMLVREAKIAARLNHPNVVQIFDLGEEDGAYFIAMEYVPGRDLASLMAHTWRLGREESERAGMSLPLKLWIVAEVAKALDYAHRRKGDDGHPLQIVHRDVSPQNVLLATEGQVKVTDFGIARADERDLGRDDDPTVLRGKYAYMSPEQARGLHLDRRSDVFSLGIVLYELVSEQRLFRAPDAKETLRRVREADVPPLDLAALGLPDALGHVLDRALEPDRDARYPSAREMGTDLTRLLFDMRAPVGEADLAEVMRSVFPPVGTARPNKLRVDLLLRAYDDATAASQPPGLAPDAPSPGEVTEVGSGSWRRRSEPRPVVLVAAPERGVSEASFDAAVVAGGGLPLPVCRGAREAMFGLERGAEHAALRAARVAFELQHAAPTAERSPFAVALATGEARALREMVVPTEALSVRAAELLARAEPGTIVADGPLAADLTYSFELSALDDGAHRVLGHRRRGERHSVLIRRGGPLVGRGAEMRQLTAALLEADEGRGGAVLVEGSAGVGRTRLLAELYALAASQDCVCLLGRSDAADHLVFGTLVDALRDLCGQEESDTPEVAIEKVRRLRVLGVSAREVRLAEELLGLEPPRPSAERPGRPRAVELLSLWQRSLRALSRDRTVLLVLEDLHWAGDGTRQLLPLLLRGLARSRVLVVMSARPGTPLPSLPATSMFVRPLGLRPAARLFASRVGGRSLEDGLARRVFEHTAGNPLWVISVADEALAAGALQVEDGFVTERVRGWPPSVPAPRAADVAATVAHASDAERDLLRIVAAFQRPVDPSAVAAVYEAPVAAVEGTLRRLLSRDLLCSHDTPAATAAIRVPEAAPRRRPTISPSPVNWRGRVTAALPGRLWVAGGSLMRTALLDTMSQTERRRLHGRIAAVLERAGAGADEDRVPELAFHAEHSDDARRAPDYLRSAAEVAYAQGDPRTAAERYARAARLLRDGDSDDVEASADAAVKGAEMALEAGDPDLAERVLRVMQGARSNDSDGAFTARLELARARALRRMNRYRAAVDALEGVGAGMDALDERLRHRVLLELGRAKVELGEVEEAAGILEAAVLEREDSDDLRARLLCALSVAHACRGDTDAAQARVAAALAIAAHLGQGDLRYLALAAMAEVQDASGAVADAGARWREAAEVAREQGLHRELARASMRAAVALLEAGRADEAVACAEEAGRLSRVHAMPGTTALATAVQGALMITAHPDASYFPKLVRAVEQLEGMERHSDAAVAVLMLALAHQALSDLPAAGRTLLRAARIARRAGRTAFEARLRDRAAALGARE